MKKKILMIAVAICALVGTSQASDVAPTPVKIQKAVLANPLANIPIEGIVAGGGTFTGTATVQSFALVGRTLTAVSTLSGTLTDATGRVIGTVTNVPVTFPVNLTGGSCKILELDLGPLNLNLLGLVVDLSAVSLDIVAQQGPGNLLGNLLCAVANLLNSNAAGNALNQVTNLLNQILGAL